MVFYTLYIFMKFAQITVRCYVVPSRVRITTSGLKKVYRNRLRGFENETYGWRKQHRSTGAVNVFFQFVAPLTSRARPLA